MTDINKDFLIYSQHKSRGIAQCLYPRFVCLPVLYCLCLPGLFLSKKPLFVLISLDCENVTSNSKPDKLRETFSNCCKSECWANLLLMLTCLMGRADIMTKIIACPCKKSRHIKLSILGDSAVEVSTFSFINK